MSRGRRAEVHATYAEFDAMTYGVPTRELARRLRVHPETVRLWRAGHRPVPWWVPKLVFFEDYHKRDVEYQTEATLARMGRSYRPGGFVRDLVANTIHSVIERGYQQISERAVRSRIETERRLLERDATWSVADFSVKLVSVVPQLNSGLVRSSIAKRPRQGPSGLPDGRGLTT